MEIKITCDCGQKFIFSVDPDNGQMPSSVNCPACGADGTKEANDILAQIFTGSPGEAKAEEAAPPPAEPIRFNPPIQLTAATSAPPPIYVPKAAAAPIPAPSKPKLAWYEQVWTALPLCLVIFGGAIGGGIGGAAWVLNRAVFQKVGQPVLRYVLTGLISVAAVVVWLVVVSVLLGMFHKR